MLATITTTSKDGDVFDSEDKIVDLAKPGNCKWLVSHIRWAVKNSKTVIIVPTP